MTTMNASDSAVHRHTWTTRHVSVWLQPEPILFRGRRLSSRGPLLWKVGAVRRRDVASQKPTALRELEFDP